MLAEEIIIAPVVTEKSNDELQEGRYTFKVRRLLKCKLHKLLKNYLMLKF